MSTLLTPETAAFAMLIGSWHRRFIDDWTVGEIADWRERIIVKGAGGAVAIVKREARHVRTEG